MCIWGRVRWYCSSFWRRNTPKTPNFGGVNRRFQAKLSKYWKFHVIETTASICTKFGTTIETITWSSWLVPLGTHQIQNGGRPPFCKKTLNRHISATVWPILMKFGKMAHTGRSLWVIGIFLYGRPGLGIFGELGVQLTLLRGAGTINSVGKNLVEESILKFTGLLVIIVNETRAVFQLQNIKFAWNLFHETSKPYRPMFLVCLHRSLPRDAMHPRY